MTESVDIAAAIAGIARAMAADPAACNTLSPALLLLCESLVLLRDAPQVEPAPKGDDQLRKIAVLELALEDRTPGERCEIICGRLGGIGRSTYFEMRKKAISLGFLRR